jgi:hypothetical protein
LDDFPIWQSALSPRGTARLGIWEGDELVACVGVRIAQVKTDTRKLCPVALIGAVATHESHRGKGYASQLVRTASEWATAKGAALAVLWGSEHSLYERLGFELAGSQVRAPVPLGQARSDLRFIEGWDERIFDQMKKRRLGLWLEEGDRAWMRAHRHTRWFRVEHASDTGTTLVAYAAHGRGIDLPDLVHEWWAPDQAERQALFAGLRGAVPQAQLLGQPELLQIESIPFMADATEFLALIKVLDPAKVVETFAYPGYRPKDLGARAFFGPPASPGDSTLKFWLWGLDAV